MALKKVAKKRVVKKTAKKRASAKATARKRVAKKTSSVQSPVAMLESEVATSRRKLAQAYERETAQREKNVAKLKLQLEKALARQRLQRERKTAAAQNLGENPTRAAKNKLIRANDAIKATAAAIRELRAALRDARSVLDDARKRQKKSNALDRAVAKFERDWAKAAGKKRRPVRRIRKTSAPAKATEASGEPEPAGAESTTD